MLGRLEMSVDDCIKTYNDLMGDVFPQPDGWSKYWTINGTIVSTLFNQEKWDSAALEQTIKTLIKRELNKDPDTVLLQDPDNPDPSCKV
jgi:hypothetical protein